MNRPKKELKKAIKEYENLNYSDFLKKIELGKKISKIATSCDYDEILDSFLND